MTGFATLTSKNQLTLSTELVAWAQLYPGARLWVQNEGRKITLEEVSGLREVQGVLVNHPLAQKHTADEIIGLARKKKVARLYKNGF